MFYAALFEISDITDWETYTLASSSLSSSICSETNYTPSLTNPCMYENISTSSTLKITANNEFNIGGSNYSLNTTIQTATLNKDFTGEFLLVPENSSNCPNITIKNVKFNNGTLTFEENGNSINLGNQYYDIGNNQWGYLYNNTQVYYINDHHDLPILFFPLVLVLVLE